MTMLYAYYINDIPINIFFFVIISVDKVKGAGGVSESSFENPKIL